MLSEKITDKDPDFKQKKTNGYFVGLAWQVCDALLRV